MFYSKRIKLINSAEFAKHIWKHIIANLKQKNNRFHYLLYVKRYNTTPSFSVAPFFWWHNKHKLSPRAMIWWRGLRQVLCLSQASTGDIWSIYEKFREENTVIIIHNFFCCHASSPFLLYTLIYNLCLLKTLIFQT